MFETGPPLIQAQIDALQARLRIVLPENYRSFLLRFNGGRPKPNFFPIEGLKGNPFGAIHYFFRIDGAIQSTNVDWNFKTYRGRIPTELLPIAGDGSGNIICLSLAGSNTGFVYFWDHDAEHIPPSYENLHLVSQSFDGFLGSIYYEDISDRVAEALGKNQLH